MGLVPDDHKLVRVSSLTALYDKPIASLIEMRRCLSWSHADNAFPQRSKWQLVHTKLPQLPVLWCPHNLAVKMKLRHWDEMSGHPKFSQILVQTRQFKPFYEVFDVSPAKPTAKPWLFPHSGFGIWMSGLGCGASNAAPKDAAVREPQTRAAPARRRNRERRRSEPVVGASRITRDGKCTASSVGCSARGSITPTWRIRYSGYPQQAIENEGQIPLTHICQMLCVYSCCQSAMLCTHTHANVLWH